MGNQRNSLLIDFLAAILLLTIVSLLFLIADRVFFEGRLSGRYYHHSKLYKMKQKVKEEKLKNLQLYEEIKLMNIELRDTRKQNQQLIDKMQLLLTNPPIPEDLDQYLKKGGEKSFNFYKALQTIPQNEVTPSLKYLEEQHVIAPPILFDNSSTKLSAAAKQTLDQAVNVLKLIAVHLPKEINWKLHINGYTDATKVSPKNPLKNNWGISTARALAVLEYLTPKGIDGKKLVASGHGPYSSEAVIKSFELPHQRLVTLGLETT